MKTFQDLMKQTSEVALASFVREAVKEFQKTPKYLQAKAGEAYYNSHNLSIENYQKTITTLSGRKTADIYSANYQLKTLFFRRLVIQQVQYVLGNGLTLKKKSNKEKLGKDFDFRLQECAKHAMAEGTAFGFWNLDHLEVFGFADTNAQAGFCPLYDEKSGKLRAGIRFWFRYVEDKEIFRGTLYEEDGYTEFVAEDKEAKILEAKRSYKKIQKKDIEGNVESELDENYGMLPIVPMYANDMHESELNGIRECIDAYDFVKSGLANNIDDSSDIYWVLKNTGGMDDVDVAQFLQRLRTVHGAVIDGDQGADAEAHTIEIPVEARKTMLEILRQDIYEDFQALDVHTLSASAKTTQEIQASYQAQDNKCADFEYYMLDFVMNILQLAGINDDPKFVWNRVVNQTEQTNMLLSASQYLTDEAIIKHLPFLTPEEADQILKERDQEDYDRFNEDEEAEFEGGEAEEEAEKNKEDK